MKEYRVHNKFLFRLWADPNNIIVMYTLATDSLVIR